jgi:hypothetical protein
MSLDVYLEVPCEPSPIREVIFVREDGQTREISRQEWDELYPDREPITVAVERDVFSRNITHNLNKMADAAGVYYACWRPEERGWEKAGDIIEPLRIGLEALQAEPAKYKSFNPENGWGTYEGLVQFVAEYLQACRDYPEATIRVSR